MSMFSGAAGLGRALRGGIAAIVFLMLFSFSIPARAQDNAAAGDLGDAPDSTNHDAGNDMHAYPGTGFANYPTVSDPNLPGPQGPRHLDPAGRSWLGGAVSDEADADLMPDDDIGPNISAFSQTANRDGADDSLGDEGIWFARCGKTSFSYTVSGAAALEPHEDYVNIWLDYNGDGDWADTLHCRDSALVVREVREWAVRNQPVTVAAGVNAVSTPQFRTIVPELGATWMRMTITATTLPAAAQDGRGPAAGHSFGETEDHLLTTAPPASADKTAQQASDGTTFWPDVAYYRTY
ncbi:MAG TPA: GEVED domain-containing protein [Herpetosiphonaceae bacterium]|nr:GEVED domain-containing protein [Herpetosiphonaceae bacterium]